MHPCCTQTPQTTFLSKSTGGVLSYPDSRKKKEQTAGNFAKKWLLQIVRNTLPFKLPNKIFDAQCIYLLLATIIFNFQVIKVKISENHVFLFFSQFLFIKTYISIFVFKLQCHLAVLSLNIYCYITLTYTFVHFPIVLSVFVDHTRRNSAK